ncbi:MAG TPA: hypothetical protein DDZ80_17365 [Cyanobacteria bacterium UBA8803]|nr:hypothetical protein [Cyanobacteria bacterium UBA9273]HBL60165.1 hypothetical protein [Cyanobacteria bacterium UBA8803]
MLSSDEIRENKLQALRRLKTKPEWKGEKEKLLLGLLEQVWQVEPEEDIGAILVRAETMDVSYFQEKMAEDVKLTTYGAEESFTLEEQFDSGERKILRNLMVLKKNSGLYQQWTSWIGNTEIKEKIKKEIEQS